MLKLVCDGFISFVSAGSLRCRSYAGRIMSHEGTGLESPADRPLCWRFAFPNDAATGVMPGRLGAGGDDPQPGHLARVRGLRRRVGAMHPAVSFPAPRRIPGGFFSEFRR